jgi:CRP-like cAMP-binding protein
MPDARLPRVWGELFLAVFGDLDDIPSWVTDRVTSRLDQQTFRAGQAIYSAGEPPAFLYFMGDGRVRVTRRGGPSWTLAGRWLLGINEALRDQPRDTTIVALQDLRLMRLPATTWVDLLEDSFELVRAAIRNAGGLVRRLEERIPELPLRAPDRVSVPPPSRSGHFTLVEKLAHLIDVRMLRGAGVQALADLAVVTEEASFGPGEIVLARGIERDRLVVVAEGEVHAERLDPRVVRTYGPGDVVCGAASFGPSSPAWEARATVPTRVIAFPIEAWFDLMEEHFDLVRSTLTALVTRRELLIDHLARESDDLVLD